MFLGISYNKWHGLLAVIVVAIVFILLRVLLADALIALIGEALTFLLMFLIGVTIAHHLQSWNESKQAIDPKVEETYGSWNKFVVDSKNDWKWFWRGILVSWIVPVLILLL